MLCGIPINNSFSAYAQAPNPTESCLYQLVDNIVPELNPIRSLECSDLIWIHALYTILCSYSVAILTRCSRSSWAGWRKKMTSQELFPPNSWIVLKIRRKNNCDNIWPALCMVHVDTPWLWIPFRSVLCDENFINSIKLLMWYFCVFTKQTNVVQQF